MARPSVAGTRLQTDKILTPAICSQTRSHTQKTKIHKNNRKGHEMLNKRSMLPILLLSTVGIQANAESLNDEDELTQAYGDTSFIYIATGTRQQISKAPAAATVITADQIASMGARTVSEVLTA